MRNPGPALTAWIVAAAITAIAPAVLVARVKVKVDVDKKFDFKPVRTWAWNPSGPGQVMMGRTAEDDREAARRLAEPIIFEAVGAEFPKRGLQAATAAPDLTVTYYLLLTTNMSAQTMGQFLPANAGWGLPLFPPATQALTAKNRGSLVLDLSAQGEIVWRGVAQAELDLDAEPKKREALLRESVRDLLRHYPPR